MKNEWAVIPLLVLALFGCSRQEDQVRPIDHHWWSFPIIVQNSSYSDRVVAQASSSCWGYELHDADGQRAELWFFKNGDEVTVTKFDPLHSNGRRMDHSALVQMRCEFESAYAHVSPKIIEETRLLLSEIGACVAKSQVAAIGRNLSLVDWHMGVLLDKSRLFIVSLPICSANVSEYRYVYELPIAFKARIEILDLEWKRDKSLGCMVSFLEYEDSFRLFQDITTMIQDREIGR